MRIALALLAVVAVAAPARAAPCFPDKRTVRPDHRLWLLAGGWDWEDDVWKRFGPKGRWGTCTAHKGIVRERDGRKVAAVYCGLAIFVPGLVDDFGIGVGMTGERVLEAYGDGPSSKLICGQTFESGVSRVRCWIPPPRGSCH